MRECFVIMPIGSGDAYKIYRNRFDEIIKPAVEGLKLDDAQVFKCVRADFVSKTGSITRDVLARLYRADVVIADLTDLNPNVFYELGVRHSLRSGTLLISLKGTRPPFDVGDLRIIPYEDRVGGEKKAIPEIQKVLRTLLEEDRPIDSPVLDAIPHLLETRASKELEAKAESLEQEARLLRAQLEISERTALANQDTLNAMRVAIDKLTAQLSDSERKEAEATIESAARERQTIKQPLVTKGLVDVAVDQKSVFVLMPFTENLQPIYEVIVAAAKEAGLTCFRADRIFAAGSIMDQIFESIAKAGLVVADLSGRNQNVMYELGIANTMGKTTLLISQDIDDVPFDLRHIRVFTYDLSFSSVKGLQDQLREAFEQYKKEFGE